MLNRGSKGEHGVQKKFGSSKRALAFYNNQMLDHLNLLMREFIVRQEMVFIATSDSQGECDCSLRAGRIGFVRILTEKLLVYPEYRGQGVYASLGNISENPHIGMIFVDFFKDTIGLHVNGEARIVENTDLLNFSNLPQEVIQDINCKGKRRSERWVLVEIEEAYIHCSKHIPLLKKLDKAIHWGTDDVVHKGGDYFKVKASRQSHVNTAPQ
jgi:hypothetical protein